MFALTQTFIGFKIIESAYKKCLLEESENGNKIKTEVYHGKYYEMLKNKLEKNI